MTFSELNNSIIELKNVENIDFFVLGDSLLGQQIYCVHVGSYAGNQIIMEGAIHAREYITAPLLVEMAKYLAPMQLNGGIYIIPMVNPDGVRLVLDGTDWLVCEKLRKFIVNVNNGNTDFSEWKANLNAVDLNVNFDALWGEGAQNVFCVSPQNFVGYYPNSEREVRNLINFTLKENPSLTLSYHTKGNVIYYGFETLSEKSLSRDLEFAKSISSITGYQLIKTEKSVGGYSDFVSMKLDVPAFTIEVGSDSLTHPITIDNLPEIFEQNKDVPIAMLNMLDNLNIHYWRITT